MEESFVVKYEDDLCNEYESYFFEISGAKNWISLYQDTWRCWKLYKVDVIIERLVNSDPNYKIETMIEQWVNPDAD